MGQVSILTANTRDYKKDIQILSPILLEHDFALYAIPWQARTQTFKRGEGSELQILGILQKGCKSLANLELGGQSKGCFC